MPFYVVIGISLIFLDVCQCVVVIMLGYPYLRPDSISAHHLMLNNAFILLLAHERGMYVEKKYV